MATAVTGVYRERSSRVTVITYEPVGHKPFDSFKAWEKQGGPRQVREMLVECGYVTESQWHVYVTRGVKSDGKSPRVVVRPMQDARYPGRVNLILKPGDNESRVEVLLRPPIGVAARSVYDMLSARFSDQDTSVSAPEPTAKTVPDPVPADSEPAETTMVIGVGDLEKLERLARLPAMLRTQQDAIKGYEKEIAEHEKSIEILRNKIVAAGLQAGACLDGIDHTALQLLLESMK